ncbi:HET-domain-containing protein [Hypoxylon sp. FL1857]|nr:HET-domain-containing protein [Hypoxylon sp. FL1857]
MRLLHTTSLHLHEFVGKHKPRYAILSHTWGEEEILFQDIQNQQDLKWKSKIGFEKVEGSCRQALLDGYDYIWIDTCCIDKTSSAELSEAINSMFVWYKNSDVCYAYLQDVEMLTDLPASRWLTRGWTLQELIAPEDVRFYNRYWGFLGDRFRLAPGIAGLTGIGMDVLTRGHVINSDPWESHTHIGNGEGFQDYNNSRYHCESCHYTLVTIDAILKRFCVAEKMNWVAKRETTRVEDIAYCLLGIFGVNMPSIYGEGLEAFRRLQEEILKRSGDQSILAWRADRNDTELTTSRSTFLAIHPRQFQLRDLYIQQKWLSNLAMRPDENVTSKMEITPGRLALTTLLCPFPANGEENELQIAILDCIVGNDLKSRPALVLERIPSGNGLLFRRVKNHLVYAVMPARQNDACEVYLFSQGGFRGFDLSSMINMANISIVEDVPDTTSYPAGYSPFWWSVQSRITPFSQHHTDSRYSIVDSIPRLLNYQARTLPASETYIVAFQNESSTFFVIWGHYLSIRCTVVPLRDLFDQLRSHSHPDLICTVKDVMDALRDTKIPQVDLQATRNSSETIGEPGMNQIHVEANARLVTFLNTTVLEVEVNISKPPKQLWEEDSLDAETRAQTLTRLALAQRKGLWRRRMKRARDNLRGLSRLKSLLARYPSSETVCLR